MIDKEHTIICPKCKTEIDFSGYANFIKDEFYKEIEKIITKHKKNDKS